MPNLLRVASGDVQYISEVGGLLSLTKLAELGVNPGDFPYIGRREKLEEKYSQIKNSKCANILRHSFK